MTTLNSYTQIADNIYQICVPLPFALRIVNCYLLRGDEGWTIVDCGLNTPPALDIWHATFDALQIKMREIHQIVLTHYHPDHFGLSGWLQNLARSHSGDIPPVLMSPHEAKLAELVWFRENGPFESELDDFWLACGLPPTILDTLLKEMDITRALTYPHPSLIKTIEAGSRLRMGNRDFEIIHAPGHSDGQILFYDAADRLILCGDQVLIKITPNIGLWPLTQPNPLERYLNSLRDLSLLDVRLGLPGHGKLITNWAQRIAEIEEHHAMRLEDILSVIGPECSTPYEISQYIFKLDPLRTHEIRFAITEILAHTEYLRAKERLGGTSEGGWRYWRL